MPDTCTPGCAVSLHQVIDNAFRVCHIDHVVTRSLNGNRLRLCDQFTSTCGVAIMNLYDAGDEDNFYTRLMGFEQSCMEEADPMFFREPAFSSVSPCFAVVSVSMTRGFDAG